METKAQIRTAKGAQYIASLCQHFGRKVPTRKNGATGSIEFPFGFCAMKADEAVLELVASAECATDLERTVEVVGSHLERFAFRENPEITWQPVGRTAPAP